MTVNIYHFEGTYRILTCHFLVSVDILCATYLVNVFDATTNK